MQSIARRLPVLVVSTAAVGGLTALAAPVASADPPPQHRSARWEPPRCKPVHGGPDWKWDDTRRGGHWDHKVWNGRKHRMEWRHEFREDRRCFGPPRGRR